MYTSSAIAKTLGQMLEIEDANKVSDKFFAFVEKYNLWNLVPAVLSHLETQANKSDDFDTLRVKVAHKLSEDSESKLREIAGADKGAKIDLELDKEVLGGFVARYRGFEHEGSFKRVVDNLEKSLRS